jgi:hypothetical protein
MQTSVMKLHAQIASAALWQNSPGVKEWDCCRSIKKRCEHRACKNLETVEIIGKTDEPTVMISVMHS